jgi:hypothetical protein
MPPIRSRSLNTSATASRSMGMVRASSAKAPEATMHPRAPATATRAAAFQRMSLLDLCIRPAIEGGSSSVVICLEERAPLDRAGQC